MKKILIACVGLFLTGVLSAQEASIASKYNLFTGEVDTVDYKAESVALYGTFGLGLGDYERDDTDFDSGTDERDLSHARLLLGGNWTPLDNLFLSFSILSESELYKSDSQLLADGSTKKELKKELTFTQVNQLQLAAKQDTFGGGFKIRLNTDKYEYEDVYDYTTRDDVIHQGDAEVNYFDYELYVTTQFIPQLSAGLAYSPEVNDKSKINFTPASSTDTYYLTGHGAQTKVHALIAPVDMVGIRLDYINEAENKSSNDAAAITNKLGAYVLAGPGIIGADYSLKKSDGYELDSEEATDGKESQPESKERILGLEYQMVATDNIHLEFRYESINKDEEKLSSETNGGSNLNLNAAYFTFLYSI